jgi:CTD small phosphatase-like protein 2
MTASLCIEVEEYDISVSDKVLEPVVGRLTVVLDMDECLLHSKFHGLGINSPSYRHNEERPESVSDVNSFWLPLEDGVAQVNMRPGLTEFLEELAQFCDVVVFTAAMQDYAGPVLDHIDPTGKLISRRLYRNSCRHVRGIFLKDLSSLGTVFASNPGRCILLDNNPCSFLCQPANGILVTSFYDDSEDTALASVLQLLKHLEFTPDVRPVLTDMFRLETILKEYRAILFPNGDLKEYEAELKVVINELDNSTVSDEKVTVLGI